MNSSSEISPNTVGQYVENDLSGCSRRVNGVLAPSTREEALDEIALGQQKGMVLHPISGGKNWGFGSRLPVQENVHILDLSKLRTIKLHLDQDYADIEPGVTQGDLDDALSAAGNSHYFNVTGAGRSTSVLGNALERGIGYFGSKKDDLLDLQIASTSGETFWTKDQPRNPYHPGLGPDLTGGYLQSGWGIAIGCKFRLRKRPPYMAALVMRLRTGASITSYFEQIALLCRENFILSVPHIVNRQRMITTFGPYVPAPQLPGLISSASDWSCLAPISGTKQLVGSVLDLVQERMVELADCHLLDSESCKADPLMTPALDLALGHPNDFALASVAYSALGQSDLPVGNLDSGRAGLIHLAPCCSSDSSSVFRLLSLIECERKSSEMPELPLTVNLVNSGAAVAIISIPFDRQNSAATAKAKTFARRLMRSCADEKFSPYRLGLEDGLELPSMNGARSRVLKQIKGCLDSGHTIADSRYNFYWEKVTPAPDLPIIIRMERSSLTEVNV